MLDLLITNGLVIDGGGAEGFRASIGVERGVIHMIRDDVSRVRAARIIDAQDRVVCPGFIDVHAHSGLMLLANPRHEPKSRQGVTTEVIGVDGNSYAPFRSRKDLADFIRLNSGLDGDPELRLDWSSVHEYLLAFDRKAPVNIVYTIGNSCLRINAVGWDAIPASWAQLADMKAMLREGLEEGAFGISTGLDYPPGSYASTAELVELCRQVAKTSGIYHTHVRYRLGDRFLDPFREAIDIGRQSGVGVHITHFYQRLPIGGAADRMLALVEEASSEVDVTFDSYPYTLSSSRLLIMLPEWVQEGGPGPLRDRLGSDDVRVKLREEVTPRAPSWSDIWLTNFARPHNHGFEGRSVAEIAALMGRNEVDAVCDLLLDEDLRVCYVGASANGDTLPLFVAHPLSMVGSDAVLLGEFPSPRTYGTFPLILSEFVRRRGYLSMPAAVRKMTSVPARRLGLSDRGLLLDGMRADIVVFDPSTIQTRATRLQPKQYPEGIDYVLVNGVPVIDSGHVTGSMPGRALRRGRPTSAAGVAH